MSNKCDAYVLQDEVCQQCGKEHKPLISRQVIFLGVAVVGLIALAIWLYRKEQMAQFWREWETIPKTSNNPFLQDWLNKGWTYHGGSYYPPGVNPE